jgi:hypothetical protein
MSKRSRVPASPLPPSSVRRCGKCGTEKTLSQFNKNRAEPTGYQWICRTCQNDLSREYHAANRETLNKVKRENARKVYASQTPEARWACQLKYSHGMTPAQWQAMRDEQDGLCYLCLRPLPEGAKEIHIDHDHRCCPKRRSCALCRRGLTCRYCNVGVGAMGDDPERMRLAADNLERAQAAARVMIAGAPQAGMLF